MKSKIYKICGVALALVLVFSLAGAFLPLRQVEAQAYTPNQWNTMGVPGVASRILSGGDVTDIAVGSDGRTVYVADNTGVWAGGFAPLWAYSVAPAILKSSWLPNFSALTTPWVLPPYLVAVAPDDPDVVVAVEGFALDAGVSPRIGPPPVVPPLADNVWYSNNGGSTWAQLAPNVWAATDDITDIAVGPARTGALLGRDVVVTTADTAPWGAGADGIWNTADDTGVGDIYCNDGSGWRAGATTAVPFPGAMDYTSLAMAPNWVGNRCVAAVGSDGAAEVPPFCGFTAGDTNLVLINVAPLYAVPVAAPQVIVGYPVNMDTAATDSPAEVIGVPPTDIVSSSVVLPADFDSTVIAGRRAFVGWTSAGPCGDDAYRVDDITVRKLEVQVAVGIQSLAYSGTISSGTLFAGQSLTTMVWYTDNPQTAIPTWTRSEKSPTSDTVGTNCVVALHPDFAANKTVYAGTSGAESALSRSKNGGVSFNQIALIKTEIDVIQDVMPTPDGSKVFMATADDGVAAYWPSFSASGFESLWVSKTPPSGSSWERVRVAHTAGIEADWGDAIGDSIVRLNPEYADEPTIYWCNRFLAAPDLGVEIQRSVDGGDVFVPRAADTTMADLTVESKDVVYFGDAGSANVYKSNNGGWFWEVPVPIPATGPIYDLEMAPSYPEKPVEGNLLVGGASNGTVYSTNGGASFRLLSSYVGGGTFMQVLADVDYAENKTVYAISNTAGQGIWRYEIGVSNAWEQIMLAGAPPGAPAHAYPATGQMTGLAMHCGVLYGSWNDPGVIPVGADSFTIIDPLAGAEAGNIVVTGGSVLVAGNSLTTVPPAGAPVPVAAGGTTPWAVAVPGDSILVTATAAGTAGAWSWTATAVAGITTDADGDASVAAGGTGVLGTGAFSLPDVAVGVGAAGVDRSLIPDVPTIANWQFETMDANIGAATLTATPNALRVGGSETSVGLWAVDTFAARPMGYDDEMAKVKPELNVPAEVPVDPVFGRNAEFNITWPQVSNATAYNLEIYTDPACTQRIWKIGQFIIDPTGATGIPAQPLSPAWVIPANTLVAGKDYFARIRCRNQAPNDVILSPWSSVERFSVTGGERVEVSYLGVQPLGPVPGAIDVPLSPGFTWSPYASSTRYEFQLSKDAGITDILAEGKVSTTGYKYDGKLDYGTTYFWRVRGIEPTVSDWSPVSSFTTEKAPPPPPAPAPAPLEPPPPVVTPAIIWAIIGIGAILVIAVIVLIVRTRRVA